MESVLKSHRTRARRVSSRSSSSRYSSQPPSKFNGVPNTGTPEPRLSSDPPSVTTTTHTSTCECSNRVLKSALQKRDSLLFLSFSLGAHTIRSRTRADRKLARFVVRKEKNIAGREMNTNERRGFDEARQCERRAEQRLERERAMHPYPQNHTKIFLLREIERDREIYIYTYI